MQKITPFLWYNDNAEEAANFYISVFKNGKNGKFGKFGNGRGDLVRDCWIVAVGKALWFRELKRAEARAPRLRRDRCA